MLIMMQNGLPFGELDDQKWVPADILVVDALKEA